MQQPFAPQDFARQDESDDKYFYSAPRMVVHIDETALAAVTETIRRHVPPGGRVLDLMSSITSHLPKEGRYQEVIGLGMNATELAANRQLTSFLVQNLNKRPELPLADAHFDAVLITVSVQYLQRPVEVFREIARVLKPGGVCIISFSDRMFPTKAVRVWRAGDNEAHIALVQRYFALAGGFARVEVERHEASTTSWFMREHDPIFAVIGTRSST